MTDRERRLTAEPSPRPRRDTQPTPIVIPRWLRLVFVLSALVLALVLMWAVPTMVIITLGGFGLSLILSFPVRRLSRSMPRSVAILVSLLTVVVVITIAALFLVPILVDQFTSLVRALPGIADAGEERLRAWFDWLRARGLLVAEPSEIAADIREDLTDFTTRVAGSVVGGIAGFVTGTFNVALTFFGILFVGIYLLADVRKVKAAYLRAAPARYRRDARELWDAFGASMAHYLGGLAIILIAQGALSALALFALGVPYPLVLGAWVSVTAIIPFVGAFLGALPAVLVAFTVSPTVVLLTVILFVVIQQFESSFLTPRIQGQTLRVHPILVFLAVIIGGGVAGMLGVILAVPTLAAGRVIFDFLRVRVVTEE